MRSVRKCLIIAAGRGRRLTSPSVAKPLCPLLGVPLIERVILTAQSAGLDDFTVVTGYEGDGIRLFLNRLAMRREIQIRHVINEDWEQGNGLSVLCAREELKAEPFLLLMADHMIEPRLLEELVEEPLEPGTVRLAIEPNMANPLVDLEDVTRVTTEGVVLRAIGKGIERYDAFDTGCFLCSDSLFAALECARAAGDTTLSGAVQLLAQEGRVQTHSVDNAFWIDVDDPAALERAETSMLSRLHKQSDGPVSRHLNRPLSARVTRVLVRTGISPNQPRSSHQP